MHDNYRTRRIVVAKIKKSKLVMSKPPSVCETTGNGLTMRKQGARQRRKGSIDSDVDVLDLSPAEWKDVDAELALCKGGKRK